MSVELIPSDEMTTLKPASEVKTIADEAEEILEQQSVAYLINEAANTGSHMVVWSKSISDELKQVLEGQGYKVIKSNTYPNRYTIKGF